MSIAETEHGQLEKLTGLGVSDYRAHQGHNRRVVDKGI